MKFKTYFYCVFLFLITTTNQAHQALGTSTSHLFFSTEQQNQLLDQLEKKNSLHSVAGLIHIQIFQKKGKQNLSGAFLLQSPNKLHLEILDDLGQTQMRIIANGNKVFFWNAQTNKTQVLKQNEKVLKKIFKLPLSVSDLAETILSQNIFTELQHIYIEKNSPQYIHLQFPQKIICLDPKYLSREQVVFFKKKNRNQILYQINYHWNRSSSKLQDLDFPQKINWDFNKPKVKVNLELENMSLNPEIAEEKFDFSR